MTSHLENTSEVGGSKGAESVPVPQFPEALAHDGAGYIWRVSDRGTQMEAFSMAPQNPDASPIPQPITFYVPEERAKALEQAVVHLMRNQARLLMAWAEGERYDEDSEVCGDRRPSPYPSEDNPDA